MKRSSIARLRRGHGFTLLELLVVLTLLGVVLALAAPALSNTVRGFAARGAANQLAVDVAFARVQAVRGARPTTFAVSDDGTRYTITVEEPGGGTRTVKTVNLATDNRGVTIAPADLSLTFDSRGLLRGGAEQTVTVTRGTNVRTLQISPIGKVRRAY